MIQSERHFRLLVLALLPLTAGTLAGPLLNPLSNTEMSVIAWSILGLSLVYLRLWQRHTQG